MSASDPAAIVVGGSAGAVEALGAILPKLPREYPLPVIVVVHLPPSRKSMLAELFQSKCHIRVVEAEDKEPICAGTVYFAPPGYHLLVERDARLSLSSDELVNYSRPSIDVLFESACDAYGRGLVGLVLTGANDDGARGLAAIVRGGGAAIVQRPETAYASAMPLAAKKACPSALCLELDQAADYLLALAEGR